MRFKICYCTNWPILQFPTAILTERNATGHVVRAYGVMAHMIEALSQMLNFRRVKLSSQMADKMYVIWTWICSNLLFSYSYLPVAVAFADDSPVARGGISFLTNDVIVYDCVNCFPFFSILWSYINFLRKPIICFQTQFQHHFASKK